MRLDKQDEDNLVGISGIGLEDPRPDQARIKFLKKDGKPLQRDRGSLGVNLQARLHAGNLRN